MTSLDDDSDMQSEGPTNDDDTVTLPENDPTSYDGKADEKGD